MRKHNNNLSNLIVLNGMFIIIIFESLFIYKSFGMPTGVDTNTSGVILIYFENFYFRINGDTPYRIEAPLGVSKDEQYHSLESKYFVTKNNAFSKAEEKIRNAKNIFTIPAFDPKNYSVNPTVEYVMHTGQGELIPGIIRRIYNINTGDTLEITTSDRSINFSLLIYSWSSDGQWLAIAKDNKIEDDKASSSIVIVNLAKKEIREYILGERIVEITWNPQSDQVAILTEEWLRARTIWNYIIPMAWIQPQTVRSFYLYIIKTNGELIRRVEIAHRIDEISCYGLFWIE